MSLLVLDELVKSFGGLLVINRVNLAVAEGEAVGLIGPNGAGKTTLFNLITGNLRPEQGRIVFDGEEISGLSPSARCRRGIARTYQIPRPFGGMTVYENVLVGATYGAGLDRQEAEQWALEALERTGLFHKADHLAGALPLLDRKRLELARALSARPRLLLLDEIAGGLTEQEVRALVAVIREIRRAGVTVVWVEHIVHALVSLVDRLAVLHYGSLIAQGKPEEVLGDPQVQEVYLGLEV